jgi:hypothetical protein
MYDRVQQGRKSGKYHRYSCRHIWVGPQWFPANQIVGDVGILVKDKYTNKYMYVTVFPTMFGGIFRIKCDPTAEPNPYEPDSATPRIFIIAPL